MGNEQQLTGGNASGRVVRVDDPTWGPTVRKPWLSHSALIERFCSRLQAAGIDLPSSFGRDDQGRAVTEFVPGRIALDLPPLRPDELVRVGRMLRAIHDASAATVPSSEIADWPVGLIPPPGAADLICHNDATPWNLLIGDRWVFIDWDGAGPSTRAWDLAYSAQAFAGLGPEQSPDEGATRLRALVLEGYGADEALAAELPALLGVRALAMFELLERSHAAGSEPWGTMFTEGHGDHWGGVADHCSRHEQVWRRALAGEPTVETTGV
ncbi:phosphotransferase [Aestuariimicrobium soli]|uniref:phosphotransferase n=1 Tax=Aestuariimicrobium soli TaxID=2035834 RepID=UPI003EBCE302